jgi:two-component system response regulator
MNKEFVSILIAEDDADDRFLLQTAFEEKGFDEKLLFVENGIEVMEYLDSMKNYSKGQSYPKIILLDLNMPKKDGREVLRELKQHEKYRRIPILVFTTNRNDNENKRCYEVVDKTDIVKPDSYEDLLTTNGHIRS